MASSLLPSKGRAAPSLTPSAQALPGALSDAIFPGGPGAPRAPSGGAPPALALRALAPTDAPAPLRAEGWTADVEARSADAAPLRLRSALPTEAAATAQRPAEPAPHEERRKKRAA